MRQLSGEYFYGNKISDYGIKKGFLDYATLSKAFQHVHNNGVVGWFDDWEPISGDPEAEVL